MKHIIAVSGATLAVKLEGKIYAHDAGIFRADVLEKIENGLNDVVVDLSKLAYIDSTGLGVIITIHKRLKEKGGKLLITGVQGLPAELFKRTRLDKVLSIEFSEQSI
jgi:anti-sigma B factor antagonist